MRSDQPTACTLQRVSVTSVDHVPETIELEIAADGMVGEIVLDAASPNIMYLGWTLVVMGGQAWAMRVKGSDVTESSGQDDMAAALTALHTDWMRGDPEAASHMLTDPGAIPNILRMMAKTCDEMANELETDGVTRFNHNEATNAL